MATTARCTGTFLGGRCPHPAPCPLHRTQDPASLDELSADWAALIADPDAHPATDEVAIRRTLVHLARQGWRIVGVSDRPSYIGPRPYTPAAVARHIATTAGDGHVYVTREGTRVALYSTLHFVLGNCPCEVLADHSDHKGLTADLADLDMGALSRLRYRAEGEL